MGLRSEQYQKSKTGLKKVFGALFNGLDNIFSIPDLNQEKTNTNNNIEDINNSVSKIEEPTVIPVLISNVENNEIPPVDSFLDEIKSERFIDNQLETIIDYNLNQQKEEIEHLKKLFNDTDIKNKRSVLVNGIHNFLSKTINICLESNENYICKNEFVSILGSIVILNNRLRNLRKIMRKENKNINYINYKDIVAEIQNQELCIDKIRELLDNSFSQLKNLKHDFVMEFYYDMDRYPETEDIMVNFMNIEYQITSKNIELDEMLKEMENIDNIKLMK